jgi:hypothetical protein
MPTPQLWEGNDKYKVPSTYKIFGVIYKLLNNEPTFLLSTYLLTTNLLHIDYLLTYTIYLSFLSTNIALSTWTQLLAYLHIIP